MFKKRVALTIVFFSFMLFVIVMLAQYDGEETIASMDRFEESAINGVLSSIENQRGTTVIKIAGDPHTYAFFAKLIELKKDEYYDFFRLAAVGDSIQKLKRSESVKLIKNGKIYVFYLVKD